MVMTASPRRRRAALAAPLAALCAAMALALSGCGAGNIIDPVAKAATTSTAAPGFRMTLALQMSSPALPAPITATGAGAFDVPDHAGALTMALHMPNLPQVTQALGSDTLTMREILRGHTVYMQLPATLRAKLPGDKPWMEIDVSRAAAEMGMPGLSTLNTSPLSGDPSQFLQYLRAVSGGVTKVGTATVDGYATTHYRATIDLSKVADRVPAANRAAVQQSIARLESLAHVTQLPVDVFIDGNHLVRRLAFTMTIAVQAVSMSMAMQLTIPQYGPQAAPAAPPASQVTNITGLAARARTGTSATATG